MTSNRSSPPPSSTAFGEAKVPLHAAFLPCTPSYFYLSACWPPLSGGSLAVLAQQVQGCAQQQDGNCDQSQDHQRILYRFLWARRAR